MIYIVKHKEYNNPIPAGYKELLVGDLFDGNGVNINDLNPYINEITAMYWLWKNCTDDIIGLVHYRRFFTLDNDILTYKDAERIINQGERNIIIADVYPTEQGLYNQLREDLDYDCERETLDKYKEYITNLEPRLAGYWDWHHLVQRNMFICKKEYIDKYFSWLMPIVIPTTVKFIIEDVDKTPQKRLIGYLLERLFGFWIYNSNFKVTRLPFKEIKNG